MPHSWWLPISRILWGGGAYTPPDPPADTSDPGWIWADGTDHEWAGVGTDACWAANTSGGGGGNGLLLEDGGGLLLEDGSRLLLEVSSSGDGFQLEDGSGVLLLEDGDLLLLE